MKSEAGDLNFEFNQVKQRLDELAHSGIRVDFQPSRRTCNIDVELYGSSLPSSPVSSPSSLQLTPSKSLPEFARGSFTIRIVFPLLYPRGAPPSFTISGLSTQDTVELKRVCICLFFFSFFFFRFCSLSTLTEKRKELVSIGDEATQQNKGCVEDCLRALPDLIAKLKPTLAQV